MWGTICTPHQFISSDGKRHQANCASIGGILRIIQSIPSPKAEPFKRWLAQVGADRLHQMQDPELGIQQSLADFKRLGYSDNWINQRLKSIEIRKDLTDQWKVEYPAQIDPLCLNLKVTPKSYANCDPFELIENVINNNNQIKAVKQAFDRLELAETAA